MKIVLMLILFAASSCSSSDSVGAKNKYIQMNDLWKMKANSDDVKKVFGNTFKVVESGIAYNYPNSNFPEIAFFFDNSNKLREQFVFLQEVALQEFKKAMDCKWKETEEVKKISHYYRIIKKGSCSALNISYETYLDLNSYEVRWKR
jgi:hypothetical protein